MIDPKLNELWWDTTFNWIAIVVVAVVFFTYQNSQRKINNIFINIIDLLLDEKIKEVKARQAQAEENLKNTL